MSDRRQIIGEKLIDLGNFIAVALIFGQISFEKRDVFMALIGIILTAIFWL